MAEALVGVLLDRLASITLKKVDQELNLIIGVDKEIENLTRTLKAIQAVLEDAEQRQVQEAPVRLWLNNLKEVSDEIDDVLGEWSYEILKQQIVEKQQGEDGGENALVAKKKVCFSIPSPCSPCCCSDGVNVVHRHGIAKKIKDLSERLALIDAERQIYQFHYIERRSEQLIKHQKTSSVLDKSFGREYEKESLVSKLLNDGGEEESVPIIIPIVGMGGIGKTTLCQLVYNDKRVKDHFDNRIWICVSEPFEEIQIVAAIAQGLGIRDHPASNALETYSQYIISCIKKIDNGEKKRDETKFLIVLDGVWNPTGSQWEQVIKPLREGARGSRILVTTRIEKVAVMMGVASCNVIYLEMLSEDDCQSLFFHFASIGREIKNHRMFEVGVEIVRKCKGLPLAVKTLGSFMRDKNSLREWESVLNSKIWKLKEFEQNVFQPLLLSYYDLTPTIRRCLLYCAIFPKDYQIDKLELISLWMSQDYLCAKEEIDDICMVGEECFKDLVMRSFFRDLKKDNEGNIKCKMHDIVHDLLQYLTINEFFILDARLLGRRFSLPDNNFRHIHIKFDSDSIYFPFKNLRTVILDGNKWVFGVQSLTQLRSLRTLNMSGFWGVIPDEIGELIHLRYLKLSGNPSNKLPETLCDLYNLQTLIITYCSSLRKLPDGMGKLTKLQHLDVRGCDSLDLSGVEKLAGLRTRLH